MLQIRSMLISDYEAIIVLWKGMAGININSFDDSYDGIARYLVRNPKTCFVAEEDGQVIGSVLSGHDGRRGFIYHLAVSQRYQGRGVGTQLVDKAVISLEQEDIAKIVCLVFATNEQGNSFWQKQGFVKREDLVYRNKQVKNS